MISYPRILHTEEAMRDGLQIESAEIPIAAKVRLLNALSETGLKEIAVGSFAAPKWTPQMRDIDEVIRGFTPRAGVRYTYSAYNEKGYERARAFTPPLSERIKEYQLAFTMCDVFARRNYNRSQADERAKWDKQIAKAEAAGKVDGGIHLSAAFGSNWTGEFTLEQRMRVLDEMWSAWNNVGVPVRRVGFSDSMSWSMPHTIAEQIRAVKHRWPEINDFNLHLHNGRGLGLASIYAAMQELDSTDTLRLQTSVGGMAGCPYCGNGRAAMMVATEDLMHMLEEMGIATGVDLYKLIEVAWLAEEVVGHPLYGFVSKCGPRPRYDRLYPMSMPRIETLEEARHFLKGPAAYDSVQASPWREPIQSYQRPDSTPVKKVGKP